MAAGSETASAPTRWRGPFASIPSRRTPQGFGRPMQATVAIAAALYLGGEDQRNGDQRREPGDSQRGQCEREEGGPQRKDGPDADGRVPHHVAARLGVAMDNGGVSEVSEAVGVVDTGDEDDAPEVRRGDDRGWEQAGSENGSATRPPTT